MNKDNLQYALIGILVGFTAGYLTKDVVSSRQPPRLTPELRAQIAMPGEDPKAGAAPVNANVAPPTGQPDQAAAMQEIEQLRTYVDRNPNDGKAVRRLADLNFDVGNWVRAQELYSHYLTIQPEDPDVLTDLGIALRETQQFDQALERFRRAQKLSPQHWQSYYNEVVVLAFDLKRFDEADRSLQELQRLQPNNPEVARLVEAVNRQRSAA